MSAHTVAAFDAELAKLTALIVDMGASVAAQIERASDALHDDDKGLAQKVIDLDKSVDAMRMRVEDSAIQLIAKRHPVAVDLREVISTLKIATDLERMGDLAKNNAKRVLAMSNYAYPAGIGANVDALTKRVREQLSDVMRAYGGRDAALAETVWQRDGEIDQLHTSLFRELLTYMMEDPRSIGFCTHLLFCAKNLERIGDHATNIAETVVFIATGRFLGGERPRGDSTPVA